jgi:hypothetical protein
MIVDLHVHAGPGGLPLDGVIARAAVAGLQGVVLVGDDAFPKVDRAAVVSPIRLFFAAEVTTDRGHYLVFLPSPEALPPLTEVFGAKVDGAWAVRDVLARTQALGGAVVAAHPYDDSIALPGGDILFTLPKLAAVEALNARHPPALSYAAVEAAETLGLPSVGGSDARHDLAHVGRAATLFAEPLTDDQSLIDALRSGACWPMDFSEPNRELLRRGPSPAREAGAPHPSGPPREGGGGGSGRRRRRR